MTQRTTLVVERILPIIGPPEGRGYDWKTEVQLFNPHDSIMTGRIQFHRTAAVALADAPAIEYTIGPGQILTYPDIVAAAGGSGHGYLVFSFEWQHNRTAPVIVARAYHGSRGSGTRGTIIEPVDPYSFSACVLPNENWFHSPTLEGPKSGSLNIPGAEERLTIDVVGSPSDNASGPISFSATLLDANGWPLMTVDRDLPETWSEEVSAEELFGILLRAGESIRIDGRTGAALIYALTTDSRTGDVRIQYLRPSLSSHVPVIP